MNCTPDLLIQYAHYYAKELGWRVFPAHSIRGGECTCPKGADCRNPGKHSRIKAWNKEATTDIAKIDPWLARWPDTNIQIATGADSGIFVVDIDPKDGGDKTLEQLQRQHGTLPKTPTCRTGSGGLHYYFRIPPNTTIRNSQSKLGNLSAPGIDIRGEGGCVVAPPSLHASGNYYQWVEGLTPWETPLADAPSWLIDLLTEESGTPEHSNSTETSNIDDDQVLELARDALEHLHPDMPRDDWIKIGMALQSTGLGDEAYEIWVTWSKKGKKYDESDIRYQWKTFKEAGNVGRPITIRTLFDKALKAGWELPDWYRNQMLDRADPHHNAQRFLEECFTDSAGKVTLVFLDGGFYQPHPYDNCYRAIEVDELRSHIYEFLAVAKVLVNSRPQNFKPKKQHLDEIIDVLKAEQHQWDVRDLVYKGTLLPPYWRTMEKEKNHPAKEIIPTKNGLLHWPSGVFLQKTRDFFNLHCANFDYEVDGRIDHWQTFLQSIWPNDPESINTLQEIMGYLRFGDNRFQKLILITGPRRSGKGTIGRVATDMIGNEGVAGTTLSSLGESFGLSNLVNKPLAIVSDARFKAHAAKQATVVERLLTISGNDMLTINRKHRSLVDVVLPTRFLILSNETPQILDASTALAGRFVILRMTQSFFGREDPQLFDKLRAELSGILDWALVGWRRLEKRGHFIMPASARVIADELREMSSPISAFVEEHCIVDECSVVQISQLFDAWEAWCKLNKTEPGSLSSFAQKLRALVPGIETFRPSMERKRPRCYRGIGLTPPYPEGYFPTLHGISKDEMQKMAEAAGFFGLSFS